MAFIELLLCILMLVTSGLVGFTIYSVLSIFLTGWVLYVVAFPLCFTAGYYVGYLFNKWREKQ